MNRRLITAALAATLLAGQPAAAEIAVSANDGKQNLINNVVRVPDPVEQDSVSIIDFGRRVRVLATVRAPASVTGPPTSVAVAPDESFALVTAARKFGSGSPPTLVPDDVVSVIRWRGGKAWVSATLHAGAGASGVSIDPAGHIAIVVNKVEGTLSVFQIDKGVLTPASKISLGADSSPSHVAFFDHGRRALVTRSGDGAVSLLKIDGGAATLLPQTLSLGRSANAVDAVSAGDFAVAAVGGTIALVDLSTDLPAVTDRAEVKATPESVKISPDARYVAVNSHNGSGALPTAPGYNPQGVVQIFRIADGKLVKVTEAPSGAWGQGVVWSRDSRRLLVQSTKDKRIDVYAFDGATLKVTTSIAMPTAPVGLRTAER